MSYSIKLKNYENIQEEYTATAATLLPGSLVEMTSAGLVQAHSNADYPILPMFAIEDELQGGGVDDLYAASSKVQVWVPQRGEQVWGVLADGESVVVGDFLSSNGDGYLKKYVPEAVASGGAGTFYGNPIVGVALEAIDLTASSGAQSSLPGTGYNKRIKLRVI